MTTQGSCRICRSDRGEHRFDILSDAGGVPVEACQVCSGIVRDNIDIIEDSCLCCRENTTDKYVIIVSNAPDKVAPICSECRNRVYFGTGSAVVSPGGAAK